MGTDTGTSDTDNINKDTDTFTTDTDNNNKDLITMRLVDKSKERKRGGPKKKSDGRFVCEKTPKDLALLEFSENPELTQDMPHNACPFDFWNISHRRTFQTMLNKTNKCAEKVIAPLRPVRCWSILNLWVPVRVDKMEKFIGLIYRIGLGSMPSSGHYCQEVQLQWKPGI